MLGRTNLCHPWWQRRFTFLNPPQLSHLKTIVEQCDCWCAAVHVSHKLYSGRDRACDNGTTISLATAMYIYMRAYTYTDK